jgi:type I restriction enzyme S subunit
MADDRWMEMSLGEFVTLQRGHDLPEGRRILGNIPILGSFGVTGWHHLSKAKGPGITVGRSGASFGVITYSKVDYWPLNTALYVIDFHGNDERFAYYFLQCFDFKSYNSGSAQPSLNRNFVHPVKVMVPPLEEQRVIAHILGTLDDKIELNRKMNETLEAMARALFKSWFVDFDPVHAKAEGGDPGLPAHLAALFPGAFAESALGFVPSGWDVTTWGTVATLEYGKSLSGYGSETGMYPVYGTNGKIGTCSKPLCPHPGVIIGRKGAYRGVHYSASPFYAIDTAFYVSPKRPLELRWAYYDLLSRDINGMDSGSAIPSTSREDFYSLPVVFPPINVQQKYTTLLEPIWQKQEQNKRDSAVLGNLRDTLLPKLISGALRLGSNTSADSLLNEVGDEHYAAS